MVSKSDLRKIRTNSEVVNVSIRFLKQEWKTILILFFKYALPAAILLGIVQIQVGKRLAGINFQDIEYLTNNIRQIYQFIVPFALLSLFISTIYYVIFHQYIKNYGKDNDQDNNTLHFAEIFPIILNAFFAIIIVSILTSIGLFFFVLPGIFIFVSLSLVMPALIVDQLSIGESLRKSWKLVNQSWWNTFSMVIIAFLLYMVCNIILMLPFYILNQMNIFEEGLRIATQTPTLPQQIATVYASAAGLLASSFSMILLIFYYFSQHEKHTNTIM